MLGNQQLLPMMLPFQYKKDGGGNEGNHYKYNREYQENSLCRTKNSDRKKKGADIM